MGHFVGYLFCSTIGCGPLSLLVLLSHGSVFVGKTPVVSMLERFQRAIGSVAVLCGIEPVLLVHRAQLPQPFLGFSFVLPVHFITWMINTYLRERTTSACFACAVASADSSPCESI